MPSPARPLSASEPSPIPEGFRAIFETHVGFVWRCLRRFGVSEPDVADASQQVFVVLYQKMDRLEPGCALRTFVYGICQRVAADFCGRAYLRRERPCSSVPESTMEATQEREVFQRQALQQLRRALERVAPEKREVFVLYEIEEIAMTQIAAMVGCPLQTAYYRLHAARNEIMALLEPGGVR
jgi:RNA polymerase sigma-70 factor, ECF subfamily